MKDVILALVVAGIFLCGYFVMKRIDSFLGNNRNAINKASEAREPSCVLLVGDTPISEVACEIQQFRDKHKDTIIILCDGSKNENINAANRIVDQNRQII